MSITAPRLLRLFDAAGSFTDWSEFDAKAGRHSIEVRGISREDLTVQIESSIFEIPSTPGSVAVSSRSGAVVEVNHAVAETAFGRPVAPAVECFR
jgi:hypothetical protein